MMDALRELSDQELHALAILDAEGLDEAMRATGLTQKQIRDANDLSDVRKRVNGGALVAPLDHAEVPVVDLVLPQRDAAEPGAAELSVAEMLERADLIGSTRAQHLAANIRRDIADLRETLAEDEGTFAARAQVGRLLAQRAELDAQIAEAEAALRLKTGARVPARSAARKAAVRKPAKAVKRVAKKRAAPSPAYSAQVREWARANGYQVGANGRMPNDIVEAYQKAQAAGASDA